MKIKYLGPGDYVNIAGFGQILKGLTADVPDALAKATLASSKRQVFEAVESESPADDVGATGGRPAGKGKK